MIDALREFLEWRRNGYADTRELGDCLRAMISEELDHLPLPGAGRTLERWQALACVAGHDLGLSKLYEGHTDALAIMAELKVPGDRAPEQGTLWGTWASEPPQARVMVTGTGASVRLNGRKAWCSGAAVVSHGLLTAWDEHGLQQLVAVPMHQPGVKVTDEGWRAVGMATTGSVDVRFDDARGWCIGKPGDYIARPGFWQGGIGIAAIWYGAAQAIGQALLRHTGKHDEPHALAHLGAVDTALHGGVSVLRAAAMQIDRNPAQDAEWLARRCRARIEHVAESVMRHVGRALGAGVYCKDAAFARLIADLPVFLRQSHAERDLEAVGRIASSRLMPGKAWAL